MPPAAVHPAAWPVEQLLRECQITRGRASGPGGQHRNKVETAVSILHRPTGLVGQASERRSQAENRREAIRRLRLRLAVEHRTVTPGPLEVPLQASDLWCQRCDARIGRIACNVSHGDFPALLAEALDALAGRRYDPSRVATVLHCTASQVVKLLAKHPPALVAVNAAREKIGQPPLH